MPGMVLVPSRTRDLRTRPLRAAAGLLLCLAGLASAGWESVSFGHVHQAGGVHAVHYHLFLGEHEHSGHGHDHDHPGERPPHEHGAPKRTTRTIALASTALFRPAAVQGLAVPLAGAAIVQILLALPLPARPLVRPSRPRPPPVPLAIPHASD